MFTRRIILSAGCILNQYNHAFFQNLNKTFTLAKILKLDNILKNQTQTIHLNSIDYKKESKKPPSSSSSSSQTDDEDDDNDDESGDDKSRINKIISEIDTTNFQKGFKIISKSVPSLRVDAVMAAGLSISRSKIEDQFYGSKLKVNSQKIIKKSIKVKDGDVLDLIVDSEKDGVVTQLNKRVIIHTILENKKDNSRAKVIFIVWKIGIKLDNKTKEF